MKVYTKRGDNGQTDLIGGTRAYKSDIRLEAYGTADELNSFIGLLRAYDLSDYMQQALEEIQNRLFTIGGYLATDRSKTEVGDWGLIKDEQITYLEHQIDEMSEDLPVYHQFILPAGNQPVSLAHICRTITRRLERTIIKLQEIENEEIDSNVLKYVNRLSDYFFILAKKIAQKDQCDIFFWKK